jgi:flagellar FliJ protein
MKKSKRLKPVIRVAQFKEQQAVIELGRAHHQLQEQLNRLYDLLDYRKEYQDRFEQTGRNGVSVNRLQSFRSFLERLETAIEQQKHAVEIAQDLLQKRKRQWFASRDKVKIYDNVSKKYLTVEIKQEDQQEQKDSDERAQRLS